MTNLFEQCDFHVHSHLSACARPEMGMQAIIDTCVERGVRYLGITDHLAAGTKPAILVQARDEVGFARNSVRVFVGCEADILDVGRHVVTDEVPSNADYICVAANHFHDRSVAQPEGGSPEAIAWHFLRMFKYACSLDFADVVAHPMYVYPGTFDPTFLESIEDDAILDCLREAKKNDIAMEISPRSLDKEQLYFRMRFLFLCREVGLRFAIGSDAHRLEMVGATRILAPIVNELDLSDDDIWLPRGAV